MKRSPMPQRKAPIKAGGFARAERIEGREVAKQRAKLASVGRLKSRGPKMTPIRKAARGEDCTIVLPGVCNHNPDTTVLCHSNRLADGKGMGLKAPDTAAAFGCSACHDVIDARAPRPESMTKEDVDDAFNIGVQRTHIRLRAKGLME